MPDQVAVSRALLYLLIVMPTKIFVGGLDAFLPAPSHIEWTTEYKVVLDGVLAFAVETTCSDGAHSIRG